MAVDDLTDLLTRATEGFTRRLDGVRDDWTAATPCTEWDVRALLNHVLVELLWVRPLLAGQTVDDVGDRFDGDLTGDDPPAAWRAALSDATSAVRDLGDPSRIVHLSYGDVTAEHYIQELVSDVLLHTWDLARATGGDDRLDDELARLVLAWTEPKAEMLAASGYFGTPVSVPADAGVQTRLLALVGRRA
jgi:uncharacterized protein (TIGR03086 family)